MQDSEERNLQQTLASMSKICRAIRACFLALVVILAGGLAALILITLLNGQETSSSVIASVVYTTVGGGFAILILWNFVSCLRLWLKATRRFLRFKLIG